MLLKRKQTQKSTYWMIQEQAKLTMVIEVRTTVACGGWAEDLEMMVYLDWGDSHRYIHLSKCAPKIGAFQHTK